MSRLLKCDVYVAKTIFFQKFFFYLQAIIRQYMIDNHQVLM